MVVYCHGELGELCRATSSTAFTAIWERVSRTIAVTEVTAAASRARRSGPGGRRGIESDPWPQVSGVGPTEILEVFRASRLPVEAIFGDDLDATVLLLAEEAKPR